MSLVSSEIHAALEQMTLGSLTAYDMTVSSEAPASQVAEAFERHPQLPGVLISGGPGTGVVRLLSRERFLEQLSQPFGHELYMRRPIRNLATAVESSTLILEVDEGVDEAAHRAL